MPDQVDERDPKIYGEDFDDPVRPIVFVPGIMGSMIRVRGSAPRILWPPVRVSGAGTHEFFRQIKDVVRVHHRNKEAFDAFPLAYPNLLLYLRRLRGPRNFHPFWYDWTQTNRASGDQLVAHVEKVLARPEYVAKGITSVDLVCHSMGGLVTWAAYRKRPDAFRRFVFYATPFRGAPKAFFVLHPRATLPLFTSFIHSLVGELVWDQLKSADDEDSLEEELKWLAYRLPSVFELLPDRRYWPRRIVVTDVHVAASFAITSMEATYYDSEWGFPQEMQTSVREAMRFKDELGAEPPGTPDTRLLLYGRQHPTYDVIDYDNFPFRFTYDDPECSSKRNGDATVPSYSGSAGEIAGSKDVPGDHSGVPEIGGNHVLMKEFLQADPA